MPFENLGMLISVKKTNSEPIKIINRKQNGSNTLDGNFLVKGILTRRKNSIDNLVFSVPTKF